VTGLRLTENIMGKQRRCPVLAILALGLVAGMAGRPPAAARPGITEPQGAPVQVTHICIITPQFARQQEFYTRLLRLEPKKFTEDYVEFQLPGAVVSLYEEASFAQLAPEAVPKPGTGGVMLELQVANVDREFERLHSLGLKLDIVLPPTTFPWGNRSFYLRDPDGNLVNVYSPVPRR
jgi:catechol 2,3-dioxygenase-like lactoylglutathione lyase family enzyme